jgi:ParB family transcriptional regulator, chromosome partitioning protein
MSMLEFDDESFELVAINGGELGGVCEFLQSGLQLKLASNGDHAPLHVTRGMVHSQSLYPEFRRPSVAKTLTRKPKNFFKFDPGNPRKSFDVEELRKLGKSMRKKQLVPLIAKPDGTVIDGERRLRAAMEDGELVYLDVIITDEDLTPAEIKEIQLETALHRADLKPYEQFLGCRDWLNLNPTATAKDLAARIDRDPSTLVRILSLAKCIPPVQAAAADGKLGPSEWYAISKVPEAEQGALLAAKLAGASRDQLEKRARTLRNGNGQSHGVRVNRLRIPLGQQGRSVTIAGSNLSLVDAIEILQETLKFARKAQGENLDGKTWVQVMKQKAKQGFNR